MQPVRPRIVSSGQVSPYATSTFVDANFQAVAASVRPSSYPSPANFAAPGTDGFWWVFVDEVHGNSPYIAWTNGASVIVKARNIVSLAVNPNTVTFDGQAAGPMGNESVPIIDDAFLRSLWAWLRTRQREGIGVITQIELDSVARAARSRSTNPGLGRAILIAAFHSGGVNRSARFMLTSPSQLVIYGSDQMPVFDRALGVFETPIAQKAMINNLGNLPMSGLSFIDRLRPASPATPAPIAPSETTRLDTPTSTQWKQPSPSLVSIGAPTSSTPVPQNAQAPAQGGAQPATTQPSTTQPQPPQGGAQAGPGVGSLAGSITQVAGKAAPYVAGAAVGLAVIGGGYWLYKRSQES